MKVLVTGAHGFIGSHLSEWLLGRGYQVRGLISPWGKLHHLSAVRTHPGLELCRADIAQAESLQGLCDDIEVVFHAAAKVSEWGPWRDFERINVRGTENLLDEAARAGVRRFVLVSSVAVHRYRGFRGADPRQAPLDGDVNHYAVSKRLAELRVMAEERLEPVSVRPGLWINGPRDSLFKRQLQALQRGMIPLVNQGEALVNPCHIGNLVHGLELAGRSPQAAGKVYLIAEPEAVSWREIFSTTASMIGAPKPRLNLPAPVAEILSWGSEQLYKALAPNRQPPLVYYAVYALLRDIHFSLQHAEAELGYAPLVSWQDGLRATLHALGMTVSDAPA